MAMTSATASSFKQSHTKRFPCPLCDHHDGEPRGHGVRCAGFTSVDALGRAWVYCQREQNAGGLHAQPGSSPPLFRHLFSDDACKCGVPHGALPGAPPQQPSANSNGKRSSSAVPSNATLFDYRHVQGELQFQVVRSKDKRTGDKKIRVRSPGANGSWVSGSQGKPSIPYRWPDFARALRTAEPEAIIFVPEGEPKVDLLWSWGLMATCNPFGAGKWPKLIDHNADAMEQLFKGRHVVVLPDHDAPGRAHASDIVKSLLGVAASIRVLNLADNVPSPKKGFDVVDWVSEVGTELAAELLDELAQKCPVVKASDVEVASGAVERSHAANEDAELAELNSKFSIIGNYSGACVVFEEHSERDACYLPYSIQRRQDFMARFQHRCKVVPDADGNPKTAPLGRWWLNHPQARRYERVEFAPGRELPGDVLNLYAGFPVKPTAGDCTLFLDHVLDNVCAGDAEHAEWLLNWMARAVQQPGDQAEVAIVLRGKRGVGKTFFADHFGALFGRHYRSISNPRHLVGNFNAHLEDCIILLADEAFYAGDKKHASVLKSLITSNTLAVERKGYDLRTVRNCLHVIMASNDAWVVPAGLDERRFLVLDVEPTQQRNTSYFARIADQMDNGGREALLQLLLGRDLRGWDHRLAPNTKSLLDQKVLTLKAAQKAIYHVLATGSHPNSLVDGDRVFIVTAHLALQTKLTAHAIGRELRLIAGESTREYVGDQRTRGFWMPNLRDARARWVREHELDGLTWPPDINEWEAADTEDDGPGDR